MKPCGFLYINNDNTVSRNSGSRLMWKSPQQSYLILFICKSKFSISERGYIWPR
jgi:hypothetical protein